MVADHLSLSLKPVLRCLDAKLCLSSSCYQMLSNGGWPWEETGSRALRGEVLRTVLRSWNSQELVSEYGQNLWGEVGLLRRLAFYLQGEGKLEKGGKIRVTIEITLFQ